MSVATPWSLEASPEEVHEWCYMIRKNPVSWLYNLFGLNLWRGPDKNHGQAELLEGIFWQTEGVAPSGHFLGKTQLCQFVPALWLLSHPYSVVVMLAADWDGLKDHVMRGMSRVQAMQPNLLPGNPTLVNWWWEEDWGVVAKSPRKVESVQGFHSRGRDPYRDLLGTLVLVDEASQLEASLYTSIKSLVGGENHFWMVGNPLNSDGPFADAIDDPKIFNVHLDGWDSPNYRAGKTLPGFEGLFGVIEEKVWRDKCGGDVNSPEYMARVRGMKPDRSMWQMIARSHVLMAVARAEGTSENPVQPILPEEDGELVLGVDVAESEAGDETVLCIRGTRTNTIHLLEGHLGMKQPDLLRRVDELMEDVLANEGKWAGIRRINVDATGMGSTLVPHLLEKQYPGVQIVKVVSQGNASDMIRYSNARAECWGRARDAFDPAGPNPLRIPKKFQDLLMQVTYLRYKLIGTQTRMELKSEVRKRIDASPDYADALVYTFAEPVGQPAFPMVNPKLHLQPAAPGVVPPANPAGKVYGLHRPWLPGGTYDCQGYLCRATWLSDVDKNATVWMHVDQDGSWTVYDAVELREPAASYWEMISTRYDQTHQYDLDVFSAREHPFKRDQHNDYIETMDQIDSRRTPLWVPPKEITGAAGLSDITRRLLASSAAYAVNGYADPYWKATGTDPRLHNRPDGLWLWPMSVVQALRIARRETNGVQDPEAESPEGLVSGGGPLVRALRLLTIAGA